MSHRASAALLALSFIAGSIASLVLAALVLLGVHHPRTFLSAYSLFRLLIVTPLAVLGGLIALAVLDTRFKVAAALFVIGVLISGLLNLHGLATNYRISFLVWLLPDDPKVMISLARVYFLIMLVSLPLLAYGLGGGMKGAIASFALITLFLVIRIAVLRVIEVDSLRVALSINYFIGFTISMLLALVFAWIAYKGPLRVRDGGTYGYD